MYRLLSRDAILGYSKEKENGLEIVIEWLMIVDLIDLFLFSVDCNARRRDRLLRQPTKVTILYMIYSVDRRQ